jgi:hypothetical protein
MACEMEAAMMVMWMTQVLAQPQEREYRNIEASKSHVSKKKIHFSVYNLGTDKLESVG